MKMKMLDFILFSFSKGKSKVIHKTSIFPSYIFKWVMGGRSRATKSPFFNQSDGMIIENQDPPTMENHSVGAKGLCF